MFNDITLEQAKEHKSYRFHHKDRDSIEESWEAFPHRWETYSLVSNHVAWLYYRNSLVQLIMEDYEGYCDTMLSYVIFLKEDVEEVAQCNFTDWVEVDCTARIATLTSWEQLEEDMWKALNKYERSGTYSITGIDEYF